MDAPINLTCPFCHVPISVSSNQAGSTTACPNCGGQFQVPAPGYTGYATGQQFPPAGSYERQAFVGKKVAAGVCGIVVGGLGIHKFILGFNNAGTIMLVVWLVGMITGMCFFIPIVASMVMSGIGLAEGIIYLTKSDDDFYYTYGILKKEWF